MCSLGLSLIGRTLFRRILSIEPKLNPKLNARRTHIENISKERGIPLIGDLLPVANFTDSTDVGVCVHVNPLLGRSAVALVDSRGCNRLTADVAANVTMFAVVVARLVLDDALLVHHWLWLSEHLGMFRCG